MLRKFSICLLTRYYICSKIGMPPKAARGRKKAVAQKISVDIPSKKNDSNGNQEIETLEEIGKSSNDVDNNNDIKSIDNNEPNKRSTNEQANGISEVNDVTEEDLNKLENKGKPLKRGRPKKAVVKALSESPSDLQQEPKYASGESLKNDTPNGVIIEKNEEIKPDSEVTIDKNSLDSNGMPQNEKNSSNDPKQEVPNDELCEPDISENGDDKSKPDVSDNKNMVENKDLPPKRGRRRNVVKTSEGDLDEPKQEAKSIESSNCDIINANSDKPKMNSPDDSDQLEAKPVALKRGRPRKVVKSLEESPDGPKFETNSESPKPSTPEKDVFEDNDKTGLDTDDKKKDGPVRRGRPRKAAKASEESVEEKISHSENKMDSTQIPSNRGRPKRNAVKKSDDSPNEKLQDEVKIPVKRGRGKMAKSSEPESEELSPVSKKRQNETSAEEVEKETKILKVNLQRSASIDKMLDEETKAKEKGGANTAKTGAKRTKEDADSEESGAKSSKIPKETKSKGQSKKDKMPDVTLLDFNNKSTSPSGEPWNLKISSWNVNGVRAWLEKDGLAYVTHEDPDIMVFQETKCSDKALPSEVNVKGYYSYWLAGDKDGYSGVGLLSKMEPISVKYGIGVEEHDNEGRVITAEYENFYLVTTYVPNAGRGLVRLDYRMQWDKDFLSYLKSLDKKKPVVLCGDLNVAHEEIDLANPKNNKRNAGFTKEEREGFSTLLSEGFIDSFRHLYPDAKGAYTFWTYMMNARAKNVGWRLDYFVLSEKLADHLCDSVIRKDVFGSDHCPITLFLNV